MEDTNKSQYVLELRNIEKEYFGNSVLKGINLKVKAGEIHAIVGENGAGKSTLMNIIFGMPVIKNTGGYKGKVLLDGKEIDIKSPNDAIELGIGMVHQEFMLMPGFTITENIKLNREILKANPVSKLISPMLKTLDVEAMRKDARKALKELGMTVDDWLPIAGLPVGYMQFVEIAREIDKENIKLLVFDEPTAVLAESEAEKLLEAMKRLAAKGIGILFITHRLDEVIAVSDTISILRDGEQVASMAKKDTTMEKIAQLMVGRKIERIERTNNRASSDSEDAIMSIKDLYVYMPGESVRGVSLDIRRGEILGIGGLAGQGKIGLANGIMGLYRSTGEVYKNGQLIELNNPRKSIENKLAFVSEDRRGVGLLLDTSIEMNIVMTSMQIKDGFLKPLLGIKAFKMMDEKKIRKHANKYIKELDIRCTGPTQYTRRLSGGNQQKVCIARALTLEPEILFVSEPTRGIDIGAKKLVLDLLIKLNEEQGMTIVMTSSELGELRSICDRIALIYDGKLQGILDPQDSDVDFGLMMAGKPGAHAKEVI
ncbi:sugar ABC transporter ATP-binding protein [Lutispora saccharofermentans]|uniref:Sugar ABC transporter ATP-binding protein n=1 Tax=Lutispora saccharofermentans TaxID=3024236 RepID=A0ABT1NL76_9FIRM|nr:sugar ABC transporter ATP-binding protein [Lutispora saccharofermentans]MCQ1531036.1 sugar ABC transporter ATP-binding protein [Lutispora saccharofermentans]